LVKNVKRRTKGEFSLYLGLKYLFEEREQEIELGKSIPLVTNYNK